MSVCRTGGPRQTRDETIPDLNARNDDPPSDAPSARNQSDESHRGAAARTPGVSNLDDGQTRQIVRMDPQVDGRRRRSGEVRTVDQSDVRWLGNGCGGVASGGHGTVDPRDVRTTDEHRGEATMKPDRVLVRTADHADQTRANSSHDDLFDYCPPTDGWGLCGRDPFRSFCPGFLQHWQAGEPRAWPLRP